MAAVTEDQWCPCGHVVGSELTRCIAGRVYGPCSDDNCGGVCEFEQKCPSPDCRCKEEEESDDPQAK